MPRFAPSAPKSAMADGDSSMKMKDPIGHETSRQAGCMHARFSRHLLHAPEAAQRPPSTSSVTTPITHGFSLRLCAPAAACATMFEAIGPDALRCSIIVPGPPLAPMGVGRSAGGRPREDEAASGRAASARAKGLFQPSAKGRRVGL